MKGAPSTGRGPEVSADRLGCLTLIGGQLGAETECLVLLEEDGRRGVVRPLSEAPVVREAERTDGGKPGSVGRHQPTLGADGCLVPMELRRVSSSVLGALPSHNEDVKRLEGRRWNGTVMEAFYRRPYGREDELPEIQATSADDGPTNCPELESESRRLSQELDQYQAGTMEESRASCRSGRNVVMSKHPIARSVNEVNGDGSTRDGELGSLEEKVGLVEGLPKIPSGPREGRKKSPGGPGGAKTEQQLKAASCDDGVVGPDLGDELGADGRLTSREARRSGRGIASRRSPRRPQVRRENALGNPESRLKRKIQLEIVKQFQGLQGDGTSTSDDAPDANWVDGLRILGSLAVCELTHLQNRVSLDSHGGTEVEMETTLGYLRTRKDLARKSSKGVEELLSDADEEDTPAVHPRPKKPGKKLEDSKKGKEESA